MTESTETKDLVEADAAPPILRQGTAPSIMLDEAMFERAKFIAKYMADAQGFTPKHLIGKPQACFAVVVLSINWKLEPFMVARCTYETPGGDIGYEGKLVQAIIEESGRLTGPVEYEHYGDWTKVQNKYRLETSQKGKKYPVPDWKTEDEKGLGVKVIGHVRGEDKPRTLDFDLLDAFPRNSTLWATRPKQQICYTAVRAFGNLVVPSLVMGVPFDAADMVDRASAARDVTPRPTRADFAEPDQTGPVESFVLVDGDGELVREFESAAEYTDALIEALRDAGADRETLWRANEDSIESLESNHREGCFEPLWEAYEALSKGEGEEEAGEGEKAADNAAEGEETAPEKAGGWHVPGISLEVDPQDRPDWKKLAADLIAAIEAAPSVAAVDTIMSEYGQWLDEMLDGGAKASRSRVMRAADERRAALAPAEAAE